MKSTIVVRYASGHAFDYTYDGKRKAAVADAMFWLRTGANMIAVLNTNGGIHTMVEAE